jgi:PAS domain S-box-containing protein
VFPIAQRSGQQAGHTQLSHVSNTVVPVTGESAGAVRNALFKSAHFLSIATDVKGVIQAFNVGAERMLGYTSAEVLHKITPADISEPREPTAPAFEALIGRASQGVEDVYELTWIGKDGRRCPLLMSVTALRDDRDGVVGYLLIGADRAAPPRQELDRTQQYLDTAEVILLALDMEGRITFLNRHAYAVLGWTGDELLGRDWIDTCLPARIRDAGRKRFQDLLAGDLTVIENPVLQKSGEERPFEWHNTLLRDEAGHIIGTLSSGVDITERNRAAQALIVAEERMRFALEAAGVGIWDMDYTTGVNRWSEILEAQYGLQPGTFRGTFEAFIELIHPDDRESVLETLGTSLKTGADFSQVNRSIWSDGTVHWLSSAGRFYFDAHGEPVRAVGISQDVTQPRAMEAAYLEAQKAEARMLQERNVALETAKSTAEKAVTRLKEVDRFKQEFLSTVSHELRTPLTSIRGSLGLLTSGAVGALTDEVVQVVTIAERNAIRLIALINDILDLERLETGRMELQFGLVSVVSVLRRAVESVEPFARQHDITLEARAVPDACSMIRADADRIVQVLVNLLSNAAKFSPPASVVTITVEPGDGWVEFRVTDRGRGVPAAHRRAIFDRFQQIETSDAREQGGTGLGLAISKSIIEQHGGTIGVESEVGIGSTFWFRVATPTRPVAQRLGRAILVCDDNAERRLSLERAIGDGGYTVITVPDADAAWAVLQGGDVAAVVLEGDAALLTRIRKEPAFEAIPVILFGSPLVVSPEALSDSLVLFLPEHVDESQLLAAVRQSVERGRAAVQARYVLLVEDDLTLLDVMARQLSRQGIAVRTATTGEEAIRVAEADPPALMVLDVGLPEHDGFDVVDAMRRRSGLKDTPVLVYTGRDLIEEQRGRLRLGPTRFLTKSKASDEEFRRLVAELRQIPRVHGVEAARRP